MASHHICPPSTCPPLVRRAAGRTPRSRGRAGGGRPCRSRRAAMNMVVSRALQSPDDVIRDRARSSPTVDERAVGRRSDLERRRCATITSYGNYGMYTLSIFSESTVKWPNTLRSSRSSASRVTVRLAGSAIGTGSRPNRVVVAPSRETPSQRAPFFAEPPNAPRAEEEVDLARIYLMDL